MKKSIDLNREAAGKLWVQQFGKRQKAVDFAGREMVKAAYNDRNSNYGWNVDHILPLSKGGKTVNNNLICCHILTNDEKADKFPCFKANTKEFEIKKNQNHYKITAKTANHKEAEGEAINFLDAAQGLKCWKQCKSNDRSIFVGYVKIMVEISNVSDQLLERYEKFLMELFETESIFVQDNSLSHRNYYMYGQVHNRIYVFTVMVGEILKREDMENFLDNCIILNTYNIYFTSNTGFDDIQIVCGMECYDNYFKMSLNCKKDIVEKQVQFIDALAIDELVRINTGAKQKLKEGVSQKGFYSYNYIFTKLKKNLKKYIKT